MGNGRSQASSSEHSGHQPVFLAEQQGPPCFVTISARFNPWMSLETNMNMSKSKVTVVALAAAAAMVALVPLEASAGGRHGGMRHGGGMMRMSSGKHHHHHHHRRHFRRIYVAPVVTEKVYTERRTIVTKKAALVRFADGKGRMFDPASSVWFDGKSNCWSGRLGWTFRNGAWFYGSHRWYEADGLWQTDAPEAPVAVDCDTVPVFAAKLKPARETKPARDTTKSGRKSVVEITDTSEQTVRTAEKGAAEKAAKPAECKKYFPSVGEMVTVPCE
jgi:hypothetical protein